MKIDVESIMAKSNNSENKKLKLTHNQTKQDHLKTIAKKIRQCDICGFETSQIPYFKNHMIGRHLRFQCEFCDRSFDSHYKFQKHFNKDHFMREKVKCEICHKQFPDKRDLTDHKKYHREKNVKCEQENCEKMFRNTHRMRTHYKKVHLKIKNERGRVCDLCGYRADCITRLKSHLNSRVHQQMKPSKSKQNP